MEHIVPGFFRVVRYPDQSVMNSSGICKIGSLETRPIVVGRLSRGSANDEEGIFRFRPAHAFRMRAIRSLVFILTARRTVAHGCNRM